MFPTLYPTIVQTWIPFHVSIRQPILSKLKETVPPLSGGTYPPRLRDLYDDSSISQHLNYTLLQSLIPQATTIPSNATFQAPAGFYAHPSRPLRLSKSCTVCRWTPPHGDIMTPRCRNGSSVGGRDPEVKAVFTVDTS